jgi:hypothetical protein
MWWKREPLVAALVFVSVFGPVIYVTLSLLFGDGPGSCFECDFPP